MTLKTLNRTEISCWTVLLSHSVRPFFCFSHLTVLSSHYAVLTLRVTVLCHIQWFSYFFSHLMVPFSHQVVPTSHLTVLLLYLVVPLFFTHIWQFHINIMQYQHHIWLYYYHSWFPLHSCLLFCALKTTTVRNQDFTIPSNVYSTKNSWLHMYL